MINSSIKTDFKLFETKRKENILMQFSCKLVNLPRNSFRSLKKSLVQLITSYVDPFFCCVSLKCPLNVIIFFFVPQMQFVLSNILVACINDCCVTSSVWKYLFNHLRQKKKYLCISVFFVLTWLTVSWSSIWIRIVL